MLQSQIHCQQQILSAEMRQSLKILQLPMAGLQAELIQFAEENPMVDLDQFYKDWQNGDSNSLMTFCEDFSGSIFETVIVRRPMKMILLRLLMAVQYNIRKPFQSM